MMQNHIASLPVEPVNISAEAPVDDRSKDEVKKDESDLYNIANFSL
jgi:hypothetical protein